MRRALRLIGCLIGLALGALSLVALFVRIVFELLERSRESKPQPSRFSAPTQPACQPIPSHVYRRADPLIYSQQYLISQGLAVTWDNPDVSVELGGVPANRHDLNPDTVYDVVARVWNGSVDAPAVNLEVQFSYLSFGVGTTKNPIGITHVDLGAKGAPGCPAFAKQSWKTPATAGHYCLLVELVWADDANPLNNVGQSNTDVKPLNSPHAAFTFEAANATDVPRRYRFAVDAYTPAPRPSCDDVPPARFPTPAPDELRARARQVRAENDRNAFGVPAGWTVVVDPPEIVLTPGELRTIKVDVTARDGFAGRKPFNVNAFDDGGALVGGVTLTVEG